MSKDPSDKSPAPAGNLSGLENQVAYPPPDGLPRPYFLPDSPPRKKSTSLHPKKRIAGAEVVPPNPENVRADPR